ncbi:hypothetical protein FA13DRAFT_1711367 [Coprinellus micaceus]|uniref:Uncharacterized protein n=1 Tax=Coprinellus micaceus TaxID=71717 RepID=A0A4Y7T4X5_COPMI|nr:hypothetical protein FA13DRAFT_1711367 [Coprinellus micaceus]
MSDIARPVSTYRSLLPFTTTAPVRDAAYSNSLPRHSPYKDFATQLDAFDRDPSKFPNWGTTKPTDILHDASSDTMPRNNAFIRVKDNKIQPIVMQGLMQYTSAIFFFDHLVRLTSTQPMNGSVLRYPRQKGWIGKEGKDKTGKNNVIKALKETKSLITNFISNCNAPSTLLLSTSSAPSETTDPILTLANEIVTSGKVSQAFAHCKNIAVIAFNIRIMSEAPGYLQIPDNVQDLDVSLTSEHSDSLLVVMSQASIKHLRLAFLLAVVITPLVVLVPFDLTTMSICIEETLLNAKRLGNQKPPGVRKLEDEVWREILAVAEGKKTAFSAMMGLKAHFVSTNAPAHLTTADLEFF